MDFGPIGTHLGCGPLRKVFAPIRHTHWSCCPQKTAKLTYFHLNGRTVPGVRKYFSARIRSGNVSSCPSLIKWGYKRFHSPSRTDFMFRWKLSPRALQVSYPWISLMLLGQNFQKFQWSKITSKDTLGTWLSRPKTVERYMHPSGTFGVLKKFCSKWSITRKCEKLMVVPGGCTYLGCGAGKIKSHIISSSPINIIE